ncbi:MAG: hypothetical protein DRO18_07480 [Thermoprotei archaeon]|nr:MAG: hypothetical protein DRO18_07480 [Thermoprotei archaeon]
MAKVRIYCFTIEPYELNGKAEFTVFKLVKTTEVETKVSTSASIDSICGKVSKLIGSTNIPRCDYVYLVVTTKKGGTHACGELLVPFKPNYVLFYKPTKLLRVGLLSLVQQSEGSDENILVTNLGRVEWFEVPNNIHVFEGFISVKSPDVYGLIMETESGVRVVSLKEDKFKPIEVSTEEVRKAKRKVRRKRRRKVSKKVKKKEKKEVKKKKARKKKRKRKKRRKKKSSS